MKNTYRRSLKAIMEHLDLGPSVALTVLIVSSTIILIGIVFFIRSAPPRKITITSGPEGSIFHGMALKYAEALGKNGIKVNVLTSRGSIENLSRISEKKTKVDLAFIQSGSEDETTRLDDLVSLGGISYQPLYFFYRGQSIERLSQMAEKRIAVGGEGSGTRKLSMELLKLNGIEESPSLITMGGKAASAALLEGKVDGAFLMGEAASLDVIRKLILASDIKLMNFKNAKAYVRKIDLLHLIELPEGILSFKDNIPSEDLTLIGPMVELIATKDLHPALSDMILDAATEIHHAPHIFRKRGEFPRAIQHRIELSDDAARFYKSGKGFLYRYLPFWPASLLNRLFVVFLPVLLLLIPVVRFVPAAFQWMGRLRIRRRYRALLRLEKKYMNEKDPQKLKVIAEQFEAIEREVQAMKVRAMFADQFYMLRSHIDYVRRLILAKKTES